jgi:hypothetical protein
VTHWYSSRITYHAQVTAEAMMLHYWTPGVYEFFLSQIQDQQAGTGTDTGAGGGAGNKTFPYNKTCSDNPAAGLCAGDVPVAVPVHGGVDFM